MNKFDATCDVLVIGSGAAALVAALRAAVSGLRVLIIEKTDWLGGTSAMSGAGIWIPANHVARASGISDSATEALTYIRACSPQGWEQTEDRLWQSFVDAAPRALEFVEKATPLRFSLVNQPDAIVEKPGAKALGRMVSPAPLSRRQLGPYARHLRSSTLVHLFTYQELVDLDPYHHPVRASLKALPKLLLRSLVGSRGQGSALMTGLIRGCMDAGCIFKLNARALELTVDQHGRASGAVIRHDGTSKRVAAKFGVLLATGGFEWNRDLLEKHFPGPVDRIGSPRANEGDGQIMAKAIGAKLDRMDQANIYPCLPTIYEGRPHGLPLTFQTEPHSIVVDRNGRRFVSEYDWNIGEAIDKRDTDTGQPLRMPVWLVGDSRFLDRSIVFRWYARYDRSWIIKEKTIETLCERMGIAASTLQETIGRFNDFCDKGRDNDFQRGETRWENYRSRGSANKLGRIEKPPFVAMSLNRSILGTKGGARTNEYGQVLRDDSSVIAGLYAAGLAMANPIGTRALGAGTSLGPNMAWGLICAETILRERAGSAAKH